VVFTGRRAAPARSAMDGGGFDGGGGAPSLAAPPVGGLGNFKGVMLCNRPSDEPVAKLRGHGGDGPAPFKAMSAATANDQLGLAPCKSAEDVPTATVKKRGPSAALRQHVRWLRELQEQMRGEKEQVEEEEKANEERNKRMRAVADKHREEVRKMIEERDRAAMETKKQPAAAEAAPKKKVIKPLWAMTAKEKEDFEDEEADKLIDFAEGLDFDRFVGDLEFRQGLEALKDRAGKLNKESEAFKDALVQDFNAKVDEDDEGRSTSAGGSPRSLRLADGLDGQSLFGDQRSEYSSYSRKSAGEERYGKGEAGKTDWDTSTACGETRQKVDAETKEVVQEVLDSVPQIKAIHSKSSVQRIVEKTQQKMAAEAPLDLVSAMRREGPAPVPVISSSEDMQQRLHKPVDPSQLPYLYRSPAV